MDLEEALMVEPGDKLIFDPQDGKDLILPSSIVEGGFVDLFPEQQVIVSSVIAYKELPRTKNKVNLSFLEQIFYKTDRFKNEKNIDLLYFEIEDSLHTLPMQSFNFPVIEKFSSYNSLDEIIDLIEMGDFVLSDYMDALVDENLYDVSMLDYIALLYVGQSLAKPMSIDEITQNKEQTINILEQKFQEGLIDEEEIEQAENLDVQEAYKIQYEANKALINFYTKTAQFCEGVISLDKGVKTYGDFVSCLSRGLIKNNIMDLFFEEGYILKKELLSYVATGYHKINDYISKKP